MRSITIGRALFALSFVAVLGLQPTASGIAQAASQRAASPTAVQAVRAVVRPYYVAGLNFTNCTTQSPRRYPSLICPETSRLRHQLSLPRKRFGGLPFCRCQGAPRTVRVRQVDNNGRVAHVNAYWNLGPGSFTDTFVVRRERAGWLVDDEYCAGRPTTTIYGKNGNMPCR